jgi:opacity protein-like surface antigen
MDLSQLTGAGNRRQNHSLYREEQGMKIKTYLLFAIAWTVIAAPKAVAQRGIEVAPFIGGQTNGGLDLSTALYNRIDVQNGLNYGVSAGYLIGRYTGVEFTWNHNQANTVAQSIGGGADRRVFGLNTNQYLGDFLLHFKDRESRWRPFVLFGAGATNLAPNRSNVSSITRFAWIFGGGAKYNFSKHLGVRLQAKWSPTYIASTTQGFWCDPFWAGCWEVGNSYFLHEFDATAGLTFRF